MNTQSRTLLKLTLIMASILALSVVASPAVAGPNGTTSLQDIINANPTDDSDTPNEAGELSVEWANTNNTDTQYADTSSTLETTVDTGYDQSSISENPAGPQTLSAGDSQIYSLVVKNKGNNANPVPFTLQLSETANGTPASFSTEWFQDTNANNTFDTGVDEKLTTGSDSELFFAENESETFYAVITAHTNASDGDSVENKFFSTDNAPIGNGSAGTPGDQWENGTVIASGIEDTNDTQNVFFTTNVAGPVLDISKSFNLISGEARPGDTVEYRLTVNNTGGDTATNVSVYDAIPDSTTLVDTGGTPGSWGDGNLSNDASSPTSGFTVSTEQDVDLTGPFNNDSGNQANTQRLKMIVAEDVGPPSNAKSSVEIRFWVNID